MRKTYVLKDIKKIKAKYNYVCKNCGSIENLQTHDPTKQHTNWQTGILLCGICHSKEHPNSPNGLFNKTEFTRYWANISAKKIADEIKCCPRTIARRIRRIGIKLGGILSEEDKNKLINSFSKETSLKREYWVKEAKGMDFTMLTVDDVAKMLNLHRVTVQRMAIEKRIPAVKIGRDWRFRSDVIEKISKEGILPK